MQDPLHSHDHGIQTFEGKLKRVLDSLRTWTTSIIFSMGEASLVSLSNPQGKLVLGGIYRKLFLCQGRQIIVQEIYLKLPTSMCITTKPNYLSTNTFEVTGKCKKFGKQESKSNKERENTQVDDGGLIYIWQDGTNDQIVIQNNKVLLG